MSLERLHEGSVKSVMKNVESERHFFNYTDRYSIFDWGAMPDELPGKGEALASMAWMFFKILEDKNYWNIWSPPRSQTRDWDRSSMYHSLRKYGVKHHCLGFCDQYGEPLKEGRSNKLCVTKYDVFRPEYERGQWNYSKYQSRPLGVLVPLEVIFRFNIEEGSSVLNRVHDEDYIKGLNVEGEIKPGASFSLPMIEFSTKLEMEDRYISYEEAKTISGLNEDELTRLLDLATLLALRLKDIFSEVGIDLLDGKFEFALDDLLNDFNEREFVLIDSIGPDELRLRYKGTSLSKENLRKVYRETSWYEGVKTSKKLAKDCGEKNWKSIYEKEYKVAPPPLLPHVKESNAKMYRTLANRLSTRFLGYPFFPQAPEIGELVKILEKKYE